MSICVVVDSEVEVDEVLTSFDEYLERVRAASPATRSCYRRHARVFLTAFADADGRLELDRLSRVAVRDYVTGLSVHFAPDSVKLIATSIRSFLRFAWVQGCLSRDLSGAVGIVVVHRFGRPPKALTPGQLQALLSAPDRSTRTGTRDYAVMVLLSRLGLRASEVAGLRLDDVDWRAGMVRARVKGNVLLSLPMPNEVGEALVGYLRLRPRSEHREIFLRVRGLPLPLTRGAVTQIVQRSATKAGIGLVHAHRLRHTLARQILAAGGGLGEVGQVLGHSTAQVTMMYSSLDLHTLRPLARQWPIGDDDE